MIEFLAGVAVGIWALPWLYIGILGAAFVLDVIFCSSDNHAFGTVALLLAVLLVVWLGTDVALIPWLGANLANVLAALALYLLIGTLWSVPKWWLFLGRLKKRLARYERPTGGRPSESYARNNKARITGWIFHWPFSMIGSLFEDLADYIVKAMGRVYDAMAERAFADWKEEGPSS